MPVQYLYILQDAKAPCIKIGISKNVSERASVIPDSIDYSRSVFFECQKHVRAIEQTTHLMFSKFRFDKETGDGYTEWFQEGCREKVLEFLTAHSEQLGLTGPTPLHKPNKSRINTLTRTSALREGNEDLLFQPPTEAARRRALLPVRFTRRVIKKFCLGRVDKTDGHSVLIFPAVCQEVERRLVSRGFGAFGVIRGYGSSQVHLYSSWIQQDEYLFLSCPQDHNQFRVPIVNIVSEEFKSIVKAVPRLSDWSPDPGFGPLHPCL